ncbi:MAG: FecR domain-containing protein, partial [Anaerohalosphaera sp.]|nr:FecR domain-containing protein [Anaerohalosphaera sp.]
QALAESEKTAVPVKIDKPEEPELRYVENRRTPLSKRPTSKLLLYTLVFSSAAMLFISVLVWLTPIKPLVAALTRDINAEWIDEDSVLEEDGGVRAGKLKLVKGMAQIEFYGGAQIILQSPAEVEFISQDKIFISSGKLVARISRDAIGFIVDTPDAKTLDLGTEFGVEVSRGCTEVHVFQGEVAIYPGDSEDKILIEQGQAKQVDYNGAVKDLPAKEQIFVRADEFDVNFMSSQGSAYHRWLSYNYQLDHDRDMVAHYTFECEDGKSDVLLNRAPATVKKLNGILGSTSHSKPDWVQGRWPQKTALKFERDRDQRITIPVNNSLSISGPITIAAWVQFPNEDMGGHLVSHRDMFKVNYQLSYDGSHYAYSKLESELQFRRYCSSDSGGAKGFLSPKRSIQSDQWYLVAVTHDNHTVRFYINGTLLSSEEYEFHAEPVDAELVIGDVNIPGFEQKRFNGTIGELAIFKRVLSGQEIARMYEAGKPE